MDPASYVAATGMKASFRALEIATNNLANANSTGFKADRPFYRILMDEAGKISGSVLAGTVVDFEPGTLKMTGNPLDLAINGEGFFLVRTPNGTRYTRNGNFTININGDLTTQEGFAVLNSSGGGITLIRGPQAINQITVSRDGEVAVDKAIVGRIGVVTFANKNSLVKEGSVLFRTADPAQPMVNPNIEQGTIEQSNVNAIEAMLELIKINRAFEFNQKAVMTLMNTINRRAVSEIPAQ
jgi:flagellar basal-body rod protein FlgF